MAVSEHCSARNRDKCRFHGTLDHARIDYDSAKEQHDRAVEDYNLADPEVRDARGTFGGANSAILNRVRNTKTKFIKARTVLDSQPSELKKLKEEIEQAHPVNLKELRDRLDRAEKFKKKQAAERKAQREREKAETEARAKNDSFFQQISGEAVKEEEEANDWKTGYKKAVSGVIAEEGSIVDGPGRSSWGSYMPAINQERTNHFRKCGALDIRNVEESEWEEWDFNSMDSRQTSHTEYNVTADATCNCGEIVKEKIEVSGTFSDITRRVLSF